MRLEPATVTGIISATDKLQLLEVSCRDKRGYAYNYLELGKELVVGESVIINTTAVHLGLGTGGMHYVVPSEPDARTYATLSGSDSTGVGGGAGGEGGGEAAAGSVEAGGAAALGAGAAAGSGGEGDGAGDAAGIGAGDGAGDGAGGVGDGAGGGHIIKLRYTPLQLNVLAVEEPLSPYHATMENATSVAGMPVICCALHSQMPLVAAAIKAKQPQAKIAYCMTDEAALPLAFSQLVSQTKALGLADVSISCGQAFGGDLEAINLYSGLLAAAHVGCCDAAIVAIGPGNVGSASAFGHTGIAQGLALNAAFALDGVPICALRVSFADKRERHRVVSHHCLTALTSVCLSEAIIALPISNMLTAEQLLAIRDSLNTAGISDRHVIVEQPIDPSEINLRGIEVKSMGRTEASDPAFFAAAFAAGSLAADLLASRQLAIQTKSQPEDQLTGQLESQPDLQVT
jgi:hypothetical protein